MRLRISGMINLFGGVIVAGVFVAVAIGVTVGNHLRVNGPVYSKIVLGKDLVADILPPPVYILEAYLEATLLYNKEKPADEGEARINELRKQYNERYDFWRASDLDNAIKNKIVVASHAEVERFWQHALQGLLPAVLQNDPSAAKVSYDNLTASYQAHRAIIDGVVKDAEAMNTAVENEASAQARNSMVLVSLTVLALLALVGAGIFAINRMVIRPIVQLTPAMRKLAEGNFEVHFPAAGRKDEIGEISAAADMIVERFGDTISVVKRSTSEVANAATEISSSTSNLSQRTEEQAASLEQTSASMEEMSQTVKKSAESARLAHDLAATTSEVANRGGAVVSDAISAMARLEETSRKIADIIVVIDEIARQTNLLALNAAVEAARAGDAGRGFAVVASEVRSLAQRSSQAAKDVKDLITGSTGQVKEGVELVNRAGAALDEITTAIRKVNTVISDIASASAEQALGIEEIGRALAMMDEATQQNSALVEESAATAKTLEEQARAMSADQRIALFKPRASADSVAGAAEPQQALKKPARAKAAVDQRPVAEGPARNMQNRLKKAVGDDVAWAEY